MPSWKNFKGIAPAKNTGPGPDPRPDCILACSAFGKIHILYWQGEGIAAQVEALGESELTEYGGLDIPDGDGIWVWEGYLASSKPDYFTRESDYWLEGKWRPAFKQEWDAFVADEWVWEPDERVWESNEGD